MLNHVTTELCHEIISKSTTELLNYMLLWGAMRVTALQCLQWPIVSPSSMMIRGLSPGSTACIVIIILTSSEVDTMLFRHQVLKVPLILLAVQLLSLQQSLQCTELPVQ